MDEEMAIALNATTGEALFSSLLITSIIAKLVQKGVLSRSEVQEMVDDVLLSLERFRATVAGGPGAIDHARSRLEALLAYYSPTQTSPPSDEPSA